MSAPHEFPCPQCGGASDHERGCVRVNDPGADGDRTPGLTAAGYSTERSDSLFDHVPYLTSDTGETVWILRSAFGIPHEGLRSYNKEFGTEWPLDTPAKAVHMRWEPRSDDEDWHQQVPEADKKTAVYWKFDV